MTKQEQEEHKKKLYEAIEKSWSITPEVKQALSHIAIPQLSSLGFLHLLGVEDIDFMDWADVMMLKSVCENGLLLRDRLYRKREGLDNENV